MADAAESERKILGRNIKRLRDKRDWSQEELGAAAGEMRQATVSDLEKGLGNPEWETIEKVAAALGVTVRELLKPPRRRSGK
jgi:transcriptional regulator with XRE-family HTH domain